jgi:hypothetical protein
MNVNEVMRPFTLSKVKVNFSPDIITSFGDSLKRKLGMSSIFSAGPGRTSNGILNWDHATSCPPSAHKLLWEEVNRMVSQYSAVDFHPGILKGMEYRPCQAATPAIKTGSASSTTPFLINIQPIPVYATCMYWGAPITSSGRRPEGRRNQVGVSVHKEIEGA